MQWFTIKEKKRRKEEKREKRKEKREKRKEKRWGKRSCGHDMTCWSAGCLVMPCLCWWVYLSTQQSIRLLNLSTVSPSTQQSSHSMIHPLTHQSTTFLPIRSKVNQSIHLFILELASQVKSCQVKSCHVMSSQVDKLISPSKFLFLCCCADAVT